ncbi:WIZ protein, partial [Crypturellus soui]|nr:WIZ protein [Crypturellus soui]
AQNLTTCEVCGACFETRKGLSSHARSHLRQLGVAESESSGAPIDLLYELVKHKGKADGGPALAKKSASPKDAAAPRPAALLALAKERPPDGGPVNKAIKSPPGFAKGLAPPGSPVLKKVPPGALPGSPSPKNPEDKSAKLPLSPLQSSPKAQWPQADDEGPLNLSDTAEQGSERGAKEKSGKNPAPLPGLRKGTSEQNDALDGSSIRWCFVPPSRWDLGHRILERRQRSPARALARSASPPSSPLQLFREGTAPRSARRARSPFQPRRCSLLPAASGSEPVRDIRCEFCGEYFENRKGLSSHARSHLRQMGVTEWYVNGSPIDTLREILKRRSHARPPGAGPKALAKSLLGAVGSLEPRGAGELHLPKKVQAPGSPLGQSPTSPPPPTARKMFASFSPPSLQKKLKQDQLRVEIKREMMAGGLHGEPHPSDCAWPPREEMSPLNLSSRADPVRDIRCEFCGEYFENRKGLSSHARSHLRQMGVTEWSVNGSPIDTLREILKKKTKPCVIKKEPHAAAIEPPGALGGGGGDDAPDPKSPGKMLPAMALPPLGGRPGKPGGSGRELSLAPLGAKAHGGFLTPLAAKRPLVDERLGAHGELKHKAYIQTELPFKSKALHEKPAHAPGEACCELCGLYFENRKALASHARAHLRQFGVTEWCVNGSPIETLREWIRHRPHKAGAYRSYIQGGRPFAKKFRRAAAAAEPDGARRLPLA